MKTKKKTPLSSSKNPKNSPPFFDFQIPYSEKMAITVLDIIVMNISDLTSEDEDFILQYCQLATQPIFKFTWDCYQYFKNKAVWNYNFFQIIPFYNLFKQQNKWATYSFLLGLSIAQTPELLQDDLTPEKRKEYWPFQPKFKAPSQDFNITIPHEDLNIIFQQTSFSTLPLLMVLTTRDLWSLNVFWPQICDHFELLLEKIWSKNHAKNLTCILSRFILCDFSDELIFSDFEKIFSDLTQRDRPELFTQKLAVFVFIKKIFLLLVHHHKKQNEINLFLYQLIKNYPEMTKALFQIEPKSLFDSTDLLSVPFALNRQENVQESGQENQTQKLLNIFSTQLNLSQMNPDDLLKFEISKLKVLESTIISASTCDMARINFITQASKTFSLIFSEQFHFPKKQKIAMRLLDFYCESFFKKGSFVLGQDFHLTLAVKFPTDFRLNLLLFLNGFFKKDIDLLCSLSLRLKMKNDFTHISVNYLIQSILLVLKDRSIIRDFSKIFFCPLDPFYKKEFYLLIENIFFKNYTNHFKNYPEIQDERWVLNNFLPIIYKFFPISSQPQSQDWPEQDPRVYFHLGFCEYLTKNQLLPQLQNFISRPFIHFINDFYTHTLNSHKTQLRNDFINFVAIYVNSFTQIKYWNIFLSYMKSDLYLALAKIIPFLSKTKDFFCNCENNEYKSEILSHLKKLDKNFTRLMEFKILESQL